MYTTLNSIQVLLTWTSGWTDDRELVLTCTGFLFSHSCSSSVVFCSTTLSSWTIFICKLPTCTCTAALYPSRPLHDLIEGTHSPSTLSTYTHVGGNWNRWRSRIFSPARNTCNHINIAFRAQKHTYTVGQLVIVSICKLQVFPGMVRGWARPSLWSY